MDGEEVGLGWHKGELSEPHPFQWEVIREYVKCLNQENSV